jgi:hypothetical protein
MTMSDAPGPDRAAAGVTGLVDTGGRDLLRQQRRMRWPMGTATAMSLLLGVVHLIGALNDRA